MGFLLGRNIPYVALNPRWSTQQEIFLTKDHMEICKKKKKNIVLKNQKFDSTSSAQE